MKLVKTALVVALVAMAVLGLALPAAAHVTSFAQTFVFLDCIDPDCDTFTARSVQGDITCTAGENYIVFGRVVQKEDPGPGYIGRFRIKGQCTGSSQTWTAPVLDESGFMVCDEPFEVFSHAKTFVGKVQDGSKVSDRDVVSWPC